ncbi:MAG: prefoldin subunit alpha [Nanoarchaeota archaeon]
MDNKNMIEAQMLNQQLEQLQQYLQNLDTQLNEIQAVKQSLEDFGKLKGGEELLVPLTNGIFFPGKMVDNTKLLVNVGDNTVVEKTVQETIQLIGKQQSEMQQYRQEAFIQFQQLMAHLAMHQMQKEAKQRKK